MLLARGPIWKPHPTDSYTWIQTHFCKDNAKKQLKHVLGQETTASLFLKGPNEPTDKWPAVKMGFSDHILVIILTHYPNIPVVSNQTQERY